ncbi:MAG: hypothetical protein E7256_04595 [Lachnospiraceae bacterium]|nr:hypothetical protein [Lachnospiraceae bacterium]
METISIHNLIKEQYGEYLNKNITQLNITQNEEEVYLEAIESSKDENGVMKEEVKKFRMDFEVRDGERFLDPANKVEMNAIKFMEEANAFTIVNIAPDIFNDAACGDILADFVISGMANEESLF